MSRAKETRRQIIESGSPLFRHSLNQKKIKKGNEGEERYRNLAGLKEQPQTRETSPMDQLLGENLPLSEIFLEGMLEEMVRLASQRIMDEENRQLSVPARTFRIISEIEKIYRIAKAKKLHTQIVDIQPVSINDIDFPIKDGPRPTGLFSYEVFLPVFKRVATTPGGNTQLDDYFHRFFRSYSQNLTSYDFSLSPQDQIAERVRVYTFVLRSLAAWGQISPNKEASLDFTFFEVAKISKKQLMRK